MHKLWAWSQNERKMIKSCTIRKKIYYVYITYEMQRLDSHSDECVQALTVHFQAAPLYVGSVSFGLKRQSWSFMMLTFAFLCMLLAAEAGYCIQLAWQALVGLVNLERVWYSRYIQDPRSQLFDYSVNATEEVDFWEVISCFVFKRSFYGLTLIATGKHWWLTKMS